MILKKWMEEVINCNGMFGIEENNFKFRLIKIFEKQIS